MWRCSRPRVVGRGSRANGERRVVVADAQRGGLSDERAADGAQRLVFPAENAGSAAAGQLLVVARRRPDGWARG